MPAGVRRSIGCGQQLQQGRIVMQEAETTGITAGRAELIRRCSSKWRDTKRAGSQGRMKVRAKRPPRPCGPLSGFAAQYLTPPVMLIG